MEMRLEEDRVREEGVESPSPSSSSSSYSSSSVYEGLCVCGVLWRRGRTRMATAMTDEGRVCAKVSNPNAAKARENHVKDSRK